MMVVELEDPLADTFLLPRTIAISLSGAEIYSGDHSGGGDLVVDLLDALAKKGSADLLQQAMEVKMDSLKMLTLQQPENEGAAVHENDNGHPEPRRPGMGRKRAQFSLRPSSSDNSQVKVAYNVDHIEDPDEYFLAVERHENAERELRRLRGEVPDNLTAGHLAETRKRRIGILGKRASFKPSFTAPVDAGESLLTSIERSNRNIVPIAQASKETNNVVTSDNTNVEGSVARMENNVDNIIYELFNSIDEVDARDEVGFLQEKLQLKPIDLGKLHLPEIISYKGNESKTTSNVVIRRKIHYSSPDLSKSPLHSIATMQRRISLGNSPRDIYSMQPIESMGRASNVQLEKTSTSALDLMNQNASGSIFDRQASLENINSGRSTPAHNWRLANTMVDEVHHNQNISEGQLESSVLISKSVTIIGSTAINDVDDGTLGGVDACFDSKGDDVQNDTSAFERLESSGKGNLTRETNISLQNTYNGDMISNCGIDNAIDDFSIPNEVSQEKGVASVDKDSRLNNDAVSANVELITTVSHVENSNVVCDQNNEIQNPAVASTDLEERSRKKRVPLQKRKKQRVDTRRRSLRDVSNINPKDLRMRREENLCSKMEENNKRLSAVEDRNFCQRSPKPKKKTDILRRQSLGGAGTRMVDGVRRSTRIRSRPLQHWCGERFVYGRIHDSLATVIGVKYVSPGCSKMKVKSYVSEAYADLVARSSLH